MARAEVPLKARSRVALSAAGLLVAAAGVVAWAFLAIERPAREERDRRADEERVLPFAPGDVREVRLEGGATALRLAYSEDGWRLAAPADAPADPAAVAAFLERLSSIRRTALVGPSDGGPRDFGLEPPRERVVVELRDGRVLSLDVGADNPFDRTLFARAGGALLLLPDSARAALGVDPASLVRPPSSPDGGPGG